jgi:alkylation response protein AidB-like acyl-CoA dehydrogenase
MGDVMVASIEFGRALALEPFLASVVLGGGALALAGSAEQKAALLPGVMSGETRLAVALHEPQGRFDLADVSTRAQADDGGFALDGAKAVVLGGDRAHRFVVSARVSGDVRDTDGLSLFVVPADAQGVTVRGYPLLDGRGAAELLLERVRVPASAQLGPAGAAYGTIEHVGDLACVALCAEAIGAIERINELTLDYLKSRQQFGRPIGSFQALQHRMVDLALEYEHAKSLCIAAAVAVESEERSERVRAVSAAKAYIGAKGRAIAAEAVQLHGGIGVTQEYALGDYVKRVMAADMLFGDADHHLERFGANMAANPSGPGVWAR